MDPAPSVRLSGSQEGRAQKSLFFFTLGVLVWVESVISDHLDPFLNF